MSLRVVVHNGGLATIVEEELGLVEILLVASNQIQLSQRHLGYLMTRHHTGLSGPWSHLTANTVGIANGNVEELTAACGLEMSNSCLHHVAQVVELMAQVLFLAPSFVASPLVGFFRVLRTRGVQIAVGFLGRGYHIENGVNILNQFLVRIGLQDIGSTFDGFVGIGVVEGESSHLEHL